MNLLSSDNYEDIINYLGLILLPDKFYKLRIVCNKFKNYIDIFKKDFV
jgi:hypothetical protein